ncbi:MAG: hypothetical protein KDB98_12120 [Flavobacteriales bacterium]|nr:hypothetical protein [Flavobacteriales bacterium]
MNLRCLFILALVATYFSAKSQDEPFKELEHANVYIGPLVDRDYGEGLAQFVGEFEGGVVTLTIYKESDQFQRYDKNLKSVKTKRIEHSSMGDGKSIVSNHGFIHSKGRKSIKRMVGVTSKKTKTNALYLVDFDLESLEMSNWVEISKVEGNYFDDFHNSWVGFKYSLDSSKVLIAHKLPEQERDDFRFRTIVLAGNDLSVIWSQDVDLHEKDGPIPSFQGKAFGNQYVGNVNPTLLNYKYLTEDMSVDNYGTVYSWAHFDLGRGIKAEERFKVRAIVIDQDETILSDEIKGNEPYLPRNDYDIVPRAKGSWLLSGLHFSDDVQNAVVLNNSGEFDLVPIDKFPLNINEIIHKTDGKMVLHSGFSTLTYVDENLRILWQVTIGMKQDFGSFNETGMSGIKVYVTDNFCFAVFNDHNENMGNLWAERELQAYYPNRGDKLVGALASIELNNPEEGQREAMWTADKLGGYYAPRWVNYNAVFGNNHYYYVQGGRKTERLVKVTLD